MKSFSFIHVVIVGTICLLLIFLTGADGDKSVNGCVCVCVCVCYLVCGIANLED